MRKRLFPPGSRFQAFFLRSNTPPISLEKGSSTSGFEAPILPPPKKLALTPVAGFTQSSEIDNPYRHPQNLYRSEPAAFGARDNYLHFTAKWHDAELGCLLFQGSVGVLLAAPLLPEALRSTVADVQLLLMQLCNESRQA